MRENMALLRWLETAVSGILFKPDRLAVRAELYAHLEDKTLDLIRIFPDIDPDEARDRALAEMGDARELKKELAQVHRPWPGWLWRCTQVLVWGLLALCLIAALSNAWGIWEDRVYRWNDVQHSQAVGQALYEDGTPDWEGERLAVLQADEEARLGRATVSVSKGARWREPEGDRLYLRLRVTWDRPWETNSMTISALWAEDDLGNTYQFSVSRALQEGWNWRQRDLALESVPPEAKELHIHHELRDGLDLAVDLTREVLP